MAPRPHEKSTQMFAGAAKAFKVDVEPFDYDKWSAAITVAKALDNLVDDDHIYNSGMYGEQVIQGKPIPYMTGNEAEFVKATYDRLSEPSKEKWLHAAAQLGAFALRRLEASNVREYLEVVRGESPFMADVLLVENDEERHDFRQRDEFNAWMYPLMRTIFVLDTFMDFAKDHNENNMNIPFTPGATGELARSALKETVVLIRATPAPVYPFLIRRSATKMAEKIGEPHFWSKQFVWKRNPKAPR